MSKGNVFWVLWIIWAIFGFYTGWKGRSGPDGPYVWGGNILLLVLFFLVGWKVFGFVISE